LLSTLRLLLPGVTVPPESAETLRRTIMGFALDESVSPARARRHLTWLLTRVLAARAVTT
jgi:hypothetical protein